MTQPPQWRFRKMVPAEINQDPVQGEFFTSTSDLAERLVRESIQNSVDAALGDGPVRVRFAFSGDGDALPADRAARYLDGLEPHLEAVALLDADDTQPTEVGHEGEEDAAYGAYDLIDNEIPMTFLVVEDLGTKGLTGNVMSNHEFEQDNRFWGFFRSVGISPNVGGTGGSWGLGKWVFPDASQLNAYLGITRRSNEQRHLLMGMAILKTHHIGDKKCPPYGQFAIRSDEPDADWLPRPVDSDEDADGIIDTAVRDFGLQRGDGPGLSVVIPWPKEELKPDAILRAVVTQYFLPIVHGDLEVEIVSEGEMRRIDRVSITDVAGGIDESDRDNESGESLVKAIDLARWAKDADESSLIDVKATTSRDVLEGQDIESFRVRFDAGERMGFRFSTNVTDRKTRAATPSTFHVYVERDEQLTSGHDYFVRGYLRIPHKHHTSSFHARALVVVERESALGNLLRDAEGPAHASWDPRAERLRKHWIGGDRRVLEVRRAAPRLLGQLAEVPRERLKNLLADLFPAPSGGSGTGPHPQPSPPLPPPSVNSPITIGDLKDGFSVRSDPANPASAALPGTKWRVAFAYDVARGGQRAPFNSYQQGVKRGAPDFSLFDGRLNVACGGCRPTFVAANEIEITVAASDFHLNVRGLDARDVIVDLRQRLSGDGIEDGHE